MIRQEEIRTISEFVNIITDTSFAGFSFFRGQNSYIDQTLLPALLRYRAGTTIRRYSDQCDMTFLNLFKSRAIQYLDYEPSDDIRWMVTAQHYGIPTRLLDWSESPLIALFFSVFSDPHQYTTVDDKPVVWCLNPIELNRRIGFLGNPSYVPNIMENNQTLNTCIDTSYAISKRVDQVLYPIAFYAPRNNNRITAQKGVFTLFPLNAQPLELMDDADNILIQILVDVDSVEDIKRDLFKIGITYSSVYPELSCISKDIIFEYDI